MVNGLAGGLLLLSASQGFSVKFKWTI